MPKKQRVIDGVGAGSLLDLKAQLYRTQENVKRKQDGLVDVEDKRKKSGFKVTDLFEKSNTGVEGRMQQDQLHVQSSDKLSDSYKALEKKAALYEKIARGELEDENEVYNVDFVRKGFLPSDLLPQPPPLYELSQDSRDPHHVPGMMSQDMMVQREREAWEAEAAERHATEVEDEARRRDKKTAIEDVHLEATRGRERVQALKDRRKEQMERNRERLRNEFLKKKLEKAKEALISSSRSNSSKPQV